MTTSLLALFSFRVCLLNYCFTMKIEAVRSSETSIYLYQTIRRYIAQNNSYSWCYNGLVPCSFCYKGFLHFIQAMGQAGLEGWREGTLPWAHSTAKGAQDRAE
jgi:hypothetical protein